MANLLEKSVIGLLDVIGSVYELIVFVPYYFLCKPYKKMERSRRIKSTSISGDPSGPYRAVEVGGNKKLATSLFEDCSTVDDLLKRAVQMFSSYKCLGTRDLLSEEDEMQSNGKIFKKVIMGEYRWITFEDMFTRVSHFGSGLLATGQQPRKNVMIFCETKAEWMIAAQACFMYNFPVVTLYATLGKEAVLHGVHESEVSHIIVSAQLTSKLKGIITRLPNVTHLIYVGDGKSPNKSDFPESVKLMSMEEVEVLGSQPDNIRTPVTKPMPDDLAVIMYTSGSTGVPKGVLITHKNLMSGMTGQCEKILSLGPKDTYIGYLPLAHVLELSAEISCLAHGACIGYSSPLTLTDNSSKIKKGSKGDVSVLRPTLMAAVPMIMDRLYKGVWEKVNMGGSFSKALFEWAYDYKKKQIEKGRNTPILDKYIFSKVSLVLGGHVRMMLSGGAPLSEKTQRFMNICFRCPVLQGYGLTETCGAGTITEVGDLSTGRVGAPLICCELRLRDWPEGNYTSKDKPCPRGEILLGGGNIVLGYHKKPEKTKEDFLEIDGTWYFCSGDIGQMDPDGCLRVIDRKKDLVKLQGGEYVAVSQVETVLKMVPIVEQIYIHADSNHDCTLVFIVPNNKHLEDLAESLGVRGELEDLCKDKKVENEVLRKLTESGIKGELERFCLPRKVKICPEPWMPESGLVTDSFKVKRKNFEEHFKDDIVEMFKK
ncbi:long-chain-fatty-acid--CoA ligase 4-like isoform X3 [Ostrea edulis]|nr:long-chain-fatty-acid--CoA ligase 4-like isoform X3 [Ostrea edulis]XP_056004488.1 long-chain-fatty-acid--CoA ligase 4-like isoform X3 [Ostrea edulis]